MMLKVKEPNAFKNFARLTPLTLPFVFHTVDASLPSDLVKRSVLILKHLFSVYLFTFSYFLDLSYLKCLELDLSFLKFFDNRNEFSGPENPKVRKI